MKWLALKLLTGYKMVISPLLPSSCRFYPTCSEYSYQAIDRFGVVRGGWMTVRRIARCNPFCEGGYDPVPERE